jgi:uncharacterized protein YjbI with pentapeptide repeats
VRTLARARTLTVLERMDPSRKRAVMQFLVKAELIQKADGTRTHIIRLDGVDLKGTTLAQIGFYQPPAEREPRGLTNLSGANLSLANLSDADLSSADLRRSCVVEANLNKANLIGAYLERVMNLGENRIEMRIPRSPWFPCDLRFPHS